METKSRYWEKADPQPYETMLHLDSVNQPGSTTNVVIKWDGCVEFNDDDDNCKIPGLVHICDLDDFVGRVAEISAIAKGHFGEDWGE